MTLKNLNFPDMLLIRQKFHVPPPVDPQAAVDRALAGISEDLKALSGLRVAVCLGSRGIDGIVPVARHVVKRIRAAGADVFVMPAMGSHGGATAKGQVEVLAHRGITEASMGCAIIADMETVRLGETADGIPLFINRLAHEADALCLINRVKPHTNFIGATESGVIKMAAIGLGNQVGAEHYHRLSLARDQYSIISSAGRDIILRKERFIGIAAVENQKHQICLIRAAMGSAIEPMETEMLAYARTLLPGLPMDDIDLLIVDEMGKNISGEGIDPNVVGRDCCTYGARRSRPRITRIFVRDLTELSVGSALGIGQADFCLSRLVRKIDTAATYVNCLTACCPEAARIPMTFDTDAQALKAAFSSIRPCTERDIGVVRIKNTMDLETLLVSEAYREEMEILDTVEILGRADKPAIDAAGMLRPMPEPGNR
ncbi:MAG: nickel-dependent lactate racemase [Deltaproteobacteria bacterium]|nr:nickel-dependent lactate racemase [Deltaproteobacteria bacterium]